MKIQSIDGTFSPAAASREGAVQAQKGVDSTGGTGIKEVKQQMARSIRGEVTEEQSKGSGRVSEEQIRSAISVANKKINQMDNTSLEFSYHEATKRVSIQVIDKESKEVVREIPPEESLDMLQKMWELAGIIVDEKR